MKKVSELIGDAWRQVEADWNRTSYQVLKRWDRLTHLDVSIIAGKRDRLVGYLGDKYGLTGEEAQQQIDEFCRARQGTRQNWTLQSTGFGVKVVKPRRERSCQ